MSELSWKRFDFAYSFVDQSSFVESLELLILVVFFGHLQEGLGEAYGGQGFQVYFRVLNPHLHVVEFLVSLEHFSRCQQLPVSHELKEQKPSVEVVG